MITPFRKLFFVALTSLASISAFGFESVVGDYRIECKTSYPKTGEGVGSMTEGLITSQIAAGYPKIISTSATKVGWTDQESDLGQVALCVTAAKK